MTSTIPTPAALLNRAADILDERGWFQGWFLSPTGCVCAIGAVNLAASESDDGHETAEDDAETEWVGISPAVQQARVESLDALAEVIEGCRISDWNDEPARTKEEVQATLRRAAGAGAE